MRVLRPCLATVVVVAGVLFGTQPAAASGGVRVACQGDTKHPGMVSAGTYASIVINGLCVGPPSGEIIVTSNVTIAPGASFLANYPSPGRGIPEGDATVIIVGNVHVGEGGTLFLGCSPGAGCVNTTADVVRGSIEARKPLGLVIHDNIVGQNIDVDGGGGGVTCAPIGIFALLGSPAFTAVEGNTIFGNLAITHMNSCWFGEYSNSVSRNDVIDNNTFADPDATEVGSNTVAGHLTCFDNSPAAQYGDGGHLPNTVRGAALGECAKLTH